MWSLSSPFANQNSLLGFCSLYSCDLGHHFGEKPEMLVWQTIVCVCDYEFYGGPDTGLARLVTWCLLFTIVSCASVSYFCIALQYHTSMSFYCMIVQYLTIRMKLLHHALLFTLAKKGVMGEVPLVCGFVIMVFGCICKSMCVQLWESHLCSP